MNLFCLAADLLYPELTLAPLTLRETEVEDGSLGAVTPADFGFTIRDFTFDRGIYCLRSVDRIPGLPSGAVKKDEYSIEAAANSLRERPFTSRRFLLLFLYDSTAQRLFVVFMQRRVNSSSARRSFVAWRRRNSMRRAGHKKPSLLLRPAF